MHNDYIGESQSSDNLHKKLLEDEINLRNERILSRSTNEIKVNLEKHGEITLHEENDHPIKKCSTLSKMEDGNIRNTQVISSQTCTSTDNLEAIMLLIRSDPIEVKCPFCRSKMMTKVSKKCSKGMIVCSILTTPLVWLIYQLVRRKDLNCQNSTHYCSNVNCMNKLGVYYC